MLVYWIKSKYILINLIVEISVKSLLYLFQFCFLPVLWISRLKFIFSTACPHSMLEYSWNVMFWVPWQHTNTVQRELHYTSSVVWWLYIYFPVKSQIYNIPTQDWFSKWEMVQLHVKRGDESQFLFSTTVDVSIETLTQQISAIYNGRLKVDRICSGMTVMLCMFMV